MKKIIVLTGPVAAGKTTLAELLCTLDGDMFHFRTRDVLHRLVEHTIRPGDRSDLKDAGELLDKTTQGKWVLDELQKIQSSIVVVDSVRKVDQLKAIRECYGESVRHIHVSADGETRCMRHHARNENYDWTEVDDSHEEMFALKCCADVAIDNGLKTKEDTFTIAASIIAPQNRNANVDVLIGGQYGSEGKGHIASFLAREYDILVRSGGPNAGHKVYESSGIYCYHHLPSGTMRNREAMIVIAAGGTLYVPMLMKEIRDCDLTPRRLAIDPHAMIVEETDREWEHRTLRGKIGSTAQGVGQATARRLLRGADPIGVRLAKDHPELQPFVRDTLEMFDGAYRSGRRVMLEGTQGSGLSLHHGQYPFVTSRDTCIGGLLAETGVPPHRIDGVTMVCRTFPIRVQSPAESTSGPMQGEINWGLVAGQSGVDMDEIKQTERTSTTNRERRVSTFNWTWLQRASLLNQPTDIAVSFADYIAKSNRKAKRFSQLTPETQDFIEHVEMVAGAPVSLVSCGFDYQSIIDRRTAK